MTETEERTKILALSQAHTIVFFDGVCSLCNGVVSTLVTQDRGHKLRYAPLQGKTAEAVLSAADRQKLSTVIVLKNSRLYRRSDAVIEVLLDLPAGPPVRPLFWLKILRKIPRPFRELGYFLVARWRYRIFGQSDTCRIPSPEERELFLD